ncbi:copper chaperone PCu(A)C [Pseudooceanicola sp. C21-150M6]|uniref:copper chaperone PCu(A)C n=1 Tax=Pseudooceanicola sp. C21-150M6 TaxID=3434355 RepID=UPI003D7F46B5
MWQGLIAGVALAVALAGATRAEIVFGDPYALSSGPGAVAGAAFMEITNTGSEDDRLVAVSTAAARKVALHTHIAGDDGVMRMRPVADGIVVPAGGHVLLERGGYHVMLMGLTAPLEQGAMVEMVLRFEKAGDITLQVPVDLDHAPGAHGDHGSMGHGSGG